MSHCVALLSGGLDSMLAIRLMQEQGIEVDAVNFKTVFTCCQDQSAQAAHRLGVKLTVLTPDDDYLDLVRRPQFGYGKGANPCVDCRIYMFERAKTFMEQIGAQFIVSGEVVGQRPMSQKRRDLETIADHSQLESLLLRPLSAKRLPATEPELRGWVDRDQLYGFVGRNRKGLIKLAQSFGFEEIPTPSTGCSLTEPLFSRKVFDLIENAPRATRWDFEVLRWGRHFRLDDATKVIVGRSSTDNEQLAYMHALPEANSSVALVPENFRGPMALLVGNATDDAIHFAAGLVLRYCNDPLDEPGQVRVATEGREFVTVAELGERERQAQTVTVADST